MNACDQTNRIDKLFSNKMNVLALVELVICMGLEVRSGKIDFLYPEILRNRYPDGINAQANDGWERPYGSYISGQLRVQKDDCSELLKGTDFVLMPNRDCVLDLQNETRVNPKAIIGSLEHVKGVKSPVLFIDSTIEDTLEGVYSLILLNVTFDLNPTFRPTWEVQVTPNREQLRSILDVVTLFDYEEVTLIARVEPHVIEDHPYDECVLDCPAGKRYDEAVVLYCLVQETWKTKSHIPDVYTIARQICSCESDLIDFGFDEEAIETCVDEMMKKDSSTTLVINGLPYDGSVDQVKRALCASFSSPGKVCAEFFCAPGCWIDLLSNSVCDLQCNNALCNFDNGDCASDLRLARETVVDLNSEQSTRHLVLNDSKKQVCTYQDAYTGQTYTQSCDQMSTPTWAIVIIVILTACCCPILYHPLRLLCLYILHLLRKTLKRRRPNRVPSGQRVTLNRISYIEYNNSPPPTERTLQGSDPTLVVEDHLSAIKYSPELSKFGEPICSICLVE